MILYLLVLPLSRWLVKLNKLKAVGQLFNDIFKTGPGQLAKAVQTTSLSMSSSEIKNKQSNLGQDLTAQSCS